MQLGEIVRQYRLEHYLSQREFASICGLTNSAISVIEKGEDTHTGKATSPTLDTLIKIAHGMDLTLHQLITRIDDMQVVIQSDERDAILARIMSKKSMRELIEVALTLPEDKLVMAVSILRVLKGE